MQKALILGATLESQMKKFFVFFPLLAVSAPLAVSTLLFNPVTPVGAKPNHRPPNQVSYDFSYLTRQRAAEHVAKAAIHLIAAQRGF